MWIDGNYTKNEDNICIPYCLRWRQRYPRNRGRYHLSAGKSSFDGWRQQASLKFENEFVEKMISSPITWSFATHTLFTELRFALLYCSQHHIATCGGRKTVQATPDASNGNNVQILGSWNDKTKMVRKVWRNRKYVRFHKRNVRPMGNPAHDIHNRAIKSGTDGSMTFTLAYTLTKARTDKIEASASIRGQRWGLTSKIIFLVVDGLASWITIWSDVMFFI